MKKIIKKIFPKNILNLLHLFFALWGSVKYNHSSEELLVIGITGTAGKSSVIHFLRQVLEFVGFKVGSLSTVDFYINGQLKLNDKKMTMVGKYFIQEKLREMVKVGCNVAIVETTSEGFLQHRHKFINYDTIVLTNLYPEHIEAHGGFENYKKAKLGIFEYVSKCRKKNCHAEFISASPGILKQVQDDIAKTAIVNGSSGYANEFLNFNFENKIKFIAKNVEATKIGLNFVVEDEQYFAPIYGAHNAENLAGVIAVVKSLNINEEKIKQAISQIKSPPGRIEFINEAEEQGFQVIVDYAFEPVALQKLYDVVDVIKPNGKIIHVCGSTGGGRDKARREPIGKLVGEKSNIFIITDEDPYNEDPQEIMEAVKVGALKSGKIEGQDLFMILKREEAIKKAIELARPGDLVLITGKGSEQKMCVAGGNMIDWDDREIVKKFICLSKRK
ncbi:MAG: UDP-N-acetylmuramyl-tripeptide synthetase [Candidatus Magasanikbacteria bacterium GW2011_GWC2_37_14]|uniref:UDP-N-acetylmuramyl-tripeptide synthetase n=1 Tax=Candidatus Magasanikbacteria bacterium GW2011_GWC2_37_14 TaxID=1619046 RepID=A0A0G0GMN8_9BACT|nr:MAG: UDP-N-acetylmuramyl-tripeptide synthetase [Candidatus Magasanikbacteria bacterium GW2011_GWC2_37_14]